MRNPIDYIRAEALLADVARMIERHRQRILDEPLMLPETKQQIREEIESRIMQIRDLQRELGIKDN
jgi:hypothetical protein